MGGGSLQCIGIAKTVGNEHLEPCTPGGLCKGPPGQRCDEDRLAAQSVTQDPSVA
jgi:putative hemolysin